MTGQAVSAADVELAVHYDDEELGRRAAELRDRRAALEVSRSSSPSSLPKRQEPFANAA